jgi:hypothetical protein
MSERDATPGRRVESAAPAGAGTAGPSVAPLPPSRWPAAVSVLTRASSGLSGLSAGVAAGGRGLERGGGRWPGRRRRGSARKTPERPPRARGHASLIAVLAHHPPHPRATARRPAVRARKSAGGAARGARRRAPGASMLTSSGAWRAGAGRLGRGEGRVGPRCARGRATAPRAPAAAGRRSWRTHGGGTARLGGGWGAAPALGGVGECVRAHRVEARATGAGGGGAGRRHRPRSPHANLMRRVAGEGRGGGGARLVRVQPRPPPVFPLLRPPTAKGIARRRGRPLPAPAGAMRATTPPPPPHHHPPLVLRPTRA